MKASLEITPLEITRTNNRHRRRFK